MRTALYRHFDADGSLLYVGASRSATERLRQHISGSHWAGDIANVTVEYFDTREEALAAEADAINRERPKHNIACVDRPLTDIDIRAAKPTVRAFQRLQTSR